MLIVSTKPQEPTWTTVLGAEVLFAPISRAMMRRARRVALSSLGRPDDAGDENAPASDQIEELGDALSLALLMEGILDWRDVCVMADDDDQGAGQPLECSPENKALMLQDPPTFEAFDAAYVVPFVMRERERKAPGKGLPLSPNGTGLAETGVTDTVTSPARPARARAAKSAPTASTKPRATKKKASGKS